MRSILCDAGVYHQVYNNLPIVGIWTCRLKHAVQVSLPRLTSKDHPRRTTSSAAAPPASFSNSTAVYIGNLQWWTTDAEIEALCTPHGGIERIRLF